MITEPLWQEQAPVPADLGVPRVPERTDVAVVGGGYTGLTAARLLARFGIGAVVLERRQLGWGASSRNGGKALVGLKPPASTVVKRFGRTLGSALWRASVEGIRLVEDLVIDQRIECDFVRSGSFFAASKPSHFSRMRRESEWLARELGYHRIEVTRDRQRDEIGTDFYHGGMVEPESAGLHPAKYAVGLARAAKEAGAVLVPEADVHRVIRTSGGYELATSRGSVRAANLIIATNGYSGPLVPAIQRLVVPVGSYLVATAPLPSALQRQISPKGRMFYDSKWFLNYFRLTPDGRMLFGGRTTISPDQDLRQSAALLRRELVAMFPALAAVPITHSWGGRLAVSFDGLPRLGRSEGIFYAVGYSGHGVALSAYLGRDLAELVAGKRTTSPFAELPDGRRFFYRGRPWFRPLLGAALRVADWLT